MKKETLMVQNRRLSLHLFAAVQVTVAAGEHVAWSQETEELVLIEPLTVITLSKPSSLSVKQII